MKFDNNQSLEEWRDKVIESEYSIALKSIKKGVDVETVMTAMAYRIQQKLLYPLLSNINKNPSLYKDIDNKE